MNKRILIAIIIFIIVVGAMWLTLISKSQGKIVTPGFSQPTAPPEAPKTFQFESSTDLKAELEKVNPQVLDSDFNE